MPPKKAAGAAATKDKKAAAAPAHASYKGELFDLMPLNAYCIGCS